MSLGSRYPMMMPPATGTTESVPRRRSYDPQPDDVAAVIAAVDGLSGRELERLIAVVDERVEQLLGNVRACEQLGDAARAALRKRAAAWATR